MRKEFSRSGIAGRFHDALPGLRQKVDAVPPPGVAWPAEERARRLLEKYRASLEQLHSAAEKGGAARYPTRFADAWAMSMNEVAGVLEAVRLLELEAYACGRRGGCNRHGYAITRDELQAVLREGKAAGWK